MQTAAEFPLDLLELGLHALAYRLAEDFEVAFPAFGAYMRKTQKFEVLRFTLTPPLAVFGRIAPEFDQPRFVGMQGQVEWSKALPQLFLKAHGFVSMLKTDQESSSPGESHPQALTEPDVNLSAHPALIVQSQVEVQSAISRTGGAPGGPHGPASEPPAVDDDGVV